MSLSLSLELTSGLAGVATLTNDGPDPTRVWRGGSERGDEPWSFELSSGGRYVSDEVYTRNSPAPVDLARGESLTRPFDLADGSWRAEGDTDGATSMVAVYDVPMTPEAAEHGIWIGALRSDPVEL